MSYANIRKTVKMKSAEKVNNYKNGGEVKKSGTTVNIVMAPARGDAAKAPIAPGAGMAPAPSRMPPPPPAPAGAGLAALGMGQPPMMANGGKVKAKPAMKAAPKKAAGGPVLKKAGSGSALGRIEKAKAQKK